MLVTQHDVDEFLAEYEARRECFGVGGIAGDEAVEGFYRWLANHPQILMCAGFQEYVNAYSFKLYRRLVARNQLIRAPRPVVRSFTGQWILPSNIGSDPDSAWDGYSLAALEQSSRRDPTGDWEECIVKIPNVDTMIDNAMRYIRSPLLEQTAFVSPKLWTPENQRYETSFLRSSMASVIAAIQAERLDLNALSPKTFEELVAEILRKNGLAIHIVRESPQGGRDIVARGQLIPGAEPLTIAVEVKHRRLVDRPEVQKALYQNRQFPALLFVTSGRFSAGVLQEARSPEQRMRLFLQDGVAIREILRTIHL